MTPRRASYAVQREGLWRRGFRKCYYCDRTLTLARGKPHSMTLDHRIPLSKDGRESYSNYAASCSPCNGAKGDMLEHEFWRAKRNGTLVYPGAVQKDKSVQFAKLMAAARTRRLANQRAQAYIDAKAHS